MNAPFHKLRAGMAELAEEVQPVDLLDRTLATSRRLRLRRTLAGSAAVVATIAAASGVAFATQSRPGPPPPPTATRPAVTATATPPATASPSPSPSTDQSRPESPTPAHTPTGNPTEGTGTPPVVSAAIPRSAMLAGRDVGSGFTVSDDISPGDHGSLFALLSYCGYGSPTWTAKDDHVVDQRGRGLTASDERYVLQEATRYDPGWAARVLVELQTALKSCRTVDIGGNPEDTSTLTIAASGFAGEGSLLVKEVRSRPDGTSTHYHLALRQGDVYAHVRLHLDGITEKAAVDIGRRAAQRLCAASPTC